MHAASSCPVRSQSPRSWRKCCSESSDPTFICYSNPLFRMPQLLLVCLIVEEMANSNALIYSCWFEFNRARLHRHWR
jgi:hypothetical protein